MNYDVLVQKEWGLFIDVCLDTIRFLVDDGEDFNENLVDMIVRDNADVYGVFLNGEDDIKKMISDVMESYYKEV